MKLRIYAIQHGRLVANVTDDTGTEKNGQITLPREFPWFEVGTEVEVRLVVEDWTGRRLPRPEPETAEHDAINEHEELTTR